MEKKSTSHTEGGDLAELLTRCGSKYAHRICGGHRGQDSVLAWLADHTGATQKELAEGLGVTPASLSELLRKLERKGCISRTKDEADHRFTRVCLTDEGRTVLDERAATETEDPFSALTREEQETLGRLLGRLLDDWKVRYPHRRRPDGEAGGFDDKRPGHGERHRDGHGRPPRRD